MIVKKGATRISILALITLVVSLALSGARTNEAKAAVSLLYFQGQHNGNSVLLEWATATELDTAYFFLERSAAEGGPYHMLESIGLVPSDAPPDGLSGAVYERQDDDGIVPTIPYWYVLVEVESSQGLESRTDPIRVAVGETSNTPTATATAVPTATPTQSIAGSSTAALSTATPTTEAVPVGSTATPTVSRTAAIRVQGTIVAGQDGAPENVASKTVADQLNGSPQALAQVTSDANGYPPPVDGEPASNLDSAQNGYPPAPPTPKIFGTKGYPAPVSPHDLSNATPSPNIVGLGTQGKAETFGEEAQVTTSSPLLGTLFLWLGFSAALVVFLSAITGAIYYYNRQRNGTD